MSEHRNAPWQTGVGKPVEVDQRALIHKVLARYPSEFTLFRELLQNSDDAEASTVEIHFETHTSRREAHDGLLMSPEMKSSEVIKWTFKNNGKSFKPEDWIRLAKIAKGNPDPAKVGAFGVGFYSLFSVTDNPVVSSGGRGMDFYWKDNMDQLFVRQGDLSEESPSPWTIFEIPLREPGPMPGTINLMRFLATSITFMVHLNDVGVFLDDNCIGRIEKVPEPVEVINIPIALKHSSPERTMVVNRLHRRRCRIQAKISHEVLDSVSTEISSCGQDNSSFASQSPPRLDTASLGLRAGASARPSTAALDLTITVFTVEVDVKTDQKLFKELLRCTAKKPPSRLQYSLVYTGKEEYDRSCVDQERQALMSIFQGLRADLNGALHPRIFIGHSTSQTTGIGGHMASSFIPTVERESIDLVDRNVAIWNRELLYIGGFLSRAVYELELSAIETLWKEGTESKSAIRERFIHILKFFTFHHSTPSQKVGKLLQKSFYACSALPLRLLSSVGVRHASDIRSFDKLCDEFLKQVPMLSLDVTQVGEGIIKELPGEHKIRTITLQDVLQDLSTHTLSEVELVSCLKWRLRHGTPDAAQLFQVASFLGSDRTSVKLSSIQYFVDSNGVGAYIPSDGPLPPTLISVEITKNFTLPQLASFGWREFTIADWLRYISQPEIRSANPKHDFTRSIEWAESVLRCVASAWSTSEEIRRLAKSVFANETCIPITDDLRRPEDTYLPSLNNPAFDGLDLPVVHFRSSRGVIPEMERFLVALGVQQHLPPRLLLTQMVETGKWKTSDLIDYLVQKARTLSPADMSELQTFEAFAKEGTETGTGKMRFRVNELYPPIDAFRQLDLPLIEWKKKSEWRDTTPEAEFLYRLGLRRFPPLDVVMNLCSQDSKVGANAFEYLCNNLQSVYHDSGCKPDDFRHIGFVRAENMDGPCLAKLDEVFLDSQWKTLGFCVIRHRHREKVLEELGVQRHPPSSLLVQVLETRPPSNEETARQWFEILSNHIPGFTENDFKHLGQLSMIPKTVSGNQTFLAPFQCYLGRSTKHDLYSKLFHFVNFGTGAVPFLRACGAKNEPTEEDVAASLVDNHKKFYEIAGHDRFLQELHDLAARQTRISNDTLAKMRSKPVLVGVRREKTTNPDGWKNTSSLCEPKEIIIVDDVDTYQLFDDLIVAAPRDMPSELERFYESLGCHRLTKVVKHQCDQSDEKEDATMCSEFQALILRRLPLFRHHNPHSGTPIPSFSSTNDIIVKVWNHLSISKTLVVGSNPTTKKRDAWATAKYEEGKVHLWLSYSAKRDMYELAVSLCRALFGMVNLSDALLLTSILSEDLDVLKQRGYEVNQAIQRLKCPEDSGLSGMPKSCNLTAPEMCTLPSNVGQSTRETRLDPKPACARPTANHSSSLGGSGAASGSLSTLSELSFAVGRVMKGIPNAIRGAIGSTRLSVEPSRQVIPLDDIQSTVNESIQASKSGQPMSLHHHYNADMTKFLKGYCDVSEPIHGLWFLGQIENVEVYTGRGIPNANTFMERMHYPLVHFVRIITPIAKIYDLPMESLRIFYDDTAGCIAFNCKGSIYLNLHYFEVWHYQDVKQDDPRRALSSWFLTLAHEIAHNLVECHNSEHEFWFWAICEAHLDKFSRLLGPPAASG